MSKGRSGRSHIGRVKSCNQANKLPSTGQIRNADVINDDGRGVKRRPVVIMRCLGNGLAAVAYCTSQEHQDQYQIKDRRGTGLTKKTYLDLKERVIPIDSIHGVRGKISELDFQNYCELASRYRKRTETIEGGRRETIKYDSCSRKHRVQIGQYNNQKYTRDSGGCRINDFAITDER